MVEADAIKNRDVLYRSLSRMDLVDCDNEIRQHLHEYSTKAAEALLVAAGTPCLFFTPKTSAKHGRI